jgi:antitoxin (DNA-binding transcriptional repressor) of toxin-antitoxin stability system
MTFIATMKTLTITSARQNLGAWLARAARGEEIGIISGAQVIALRPVAIAAADYAEQEYRLTQAELAKAAEKIHEEIDAAETIEFTGDLRAAFASASLADQALSQPRGKAGARRNRGGKRRVASAA